MCKFIEMSRYLDAIVVLLIAVVLSNAQDLDKEECSNASLSVVISNDMPPNTTVVLDVNCVSPSSQQATNYIYPGSLPFPMPFTLSSQNGNPTFTLNQSIATRVESLQVTIQPLYAQQVGNSTIDVTLNMIYMNDAPRFLRYRDRTLINMREDAPVGGVLVSMTVVDPDVGQPPNETNNWGILTAVSKDLPSFLDVNLSALGGTSFEVTIKVSKPIDIDRYSTSEMYEPTSSYMIPVHLSVVDGPGLSANLTVYFDIVDVDDNHPVCDPSEITEWLPSTNNIPDYPYLDVVDMNVVCKDADFDYMNRRANYTILPDHNCGRNAFAKIEPGSGHLNVYNGFLANKTACTVRVNVTDLTTSTILTIHLKFRECPAGNDSRGVVWPVGRLGTVMYATCPMNMNGFVTRFCGLDGVYEDPYYNCTRRSIQDIRAKTYSPQFNSTDILNELSNVTSPVATKSYPLMPGDLGSVKEIISTVIQRINPGAPGIGASTDAFLDVVNNLIQEDVTPTWKSIITETGSGADSVMTRVDQFVSKVASSSTNNSAINKEYAKSNIFLSISSIETCTKRISFPDSTSRRLPAWAANTKDNLRIDCSKSNNQRTYSTAMYRNLSHMMPVQIEGQPFDTFGHTRACQSYSNLGVITSEFLGLDCKRLTASPLESAVEGKVTEQSINAPVMSFTFYPETQGNLPSPIELTFQLYDKSLDQPVCSYWKIYGRDNGTWSTDGCYIANRDNNKGTVVCRCNHLTNFAVLMSPSGGSKAHHAALTVISMVGCVISMLGLVITVVVYALCWRLVSSERAKLLMHLCAVLFLALLLFLCGVNQTQHVGLCTTFAILLHYLYLLVFFLMLAEGVHLSYTVLKPLSTRKIGVPVVIAAYVTPLVIVAISMGATQLEGYGNDNFCWLSISSGLIWAFIAPVLVIIMCNIVILILVLRQLFGTTAMNKKTDREKAKAGVRSICILLPIFGITWLFGVFSVNESAVVFQYLFAICNSLQGFLIFIVQCVMNRKIQELVKQKRQKWGSEGTSSTELRSQTNTAGGEASGTERSGVQS